MYQKATSCMEVLVTTLDKNLNRETERDKRFNL